MCVDLKCIVLHDFYRSVWVKICEKLNSWHFKENIPRVFFLKRRTLGSLLAENFTFFCHGNHGCLNLQFSETIRSLYPEAWVMLLLLELLLMAKWFVYKVIFDSITGALAQTVVYTRLCLQTVNGFFGISRSTSYAVPRRFFLVHLFGNSCRWHHGPMCTDDCCLSLPS